MSCDLKVQLFFCTHSVFNNSYSFPINGLSIDLWVHWVYFYEMIDLIPSSLLKEEGVFAIVEQNTNIILEGFFMLTVCSFKLLGWFFFSLKPQNSNVEFFLCLIDRCTEDLKKCEEAP